MAIYYKKTRGLNQKMNRKPPELHVYDVTKSRSGNVADLPKSIKTRIPKAYWLDNFELWDKDRFIRETADFLYTVYGIGNEQDQHTLAMLSDQIELYVQCSKGIKSKGVITKYNDGKTLGPNPYIPIRDKTLKSIIQLMNELGLTPRSRLAAGKQEDNSPVAQFLRGPLAQ